MELDPEICYRALRARDARFDGRFFVGVTSTGIYCRPICRARLPRPENCRYFPSAAAAEQAGFRPCLLCRPELAPGLAAVDAGERLAVTAADLIGQGALERGGLAGLSARLGITARHLRRVFRDRFGVSPADFARSQRLLLAKRLLTDTAMTVTEVAFASGFGSLRRFNAVFKERYRLAPTTLRRQGAPGTRPDAACLELGFRPPYDWTGLLTFLGPRCLAGVEAVDGTTYRRTVRLDGADGRRTGWLEVSPAPGKDALLARVSASLVPVLPRLLGRLRRLFDLDCDPAAIAAGLGALAADHPGLRLPGTMDGFEVAVRAIIGQQVSVAGARTLAGRFVASLGEPVDTPFAELTTVFPDPVRVAPLDAAQLAHLGLIRSRAGAIRALARAIRDDGLVLAAPEADIAATLAALRALPGIGDWTAQYVAMRALAWPDAFPHTDLGVRKALGTADAATILARAETWRPWRAYAVMHLWRTLEDAAPSKQAEAS